MKKLTTILTMFCALSLFAQSPAVSVPQKTKKLSLQFEAGVNNFHNYGDAFFERYDISQSHYEAVTVEKELNPTFSISLGIRNINYGLKLSHLTTLDNNGNLISNNINVKYNYWTIQTPLQIKIKPFKSKALSLNFGGYLGFNYYNSASSSNSNITANPNEDKQLMDKGIIAGLDYIWLKKGNFTFGNSLSYYCGLSDLNPMQPFLVAFGIPHIVTKSQGITIGFTGKWGL